MRRLLAVAGVAALLAASARHRRTGPPRRVALTFRDGTGVELDPGSPQARELQDLAARLIGHQVLDRPVRQRRGHRHVEPRSPPP